MLTSETCPTHEQSEYSQYCAYFFLGFRVRVSRIFAAGKVGVGLLWLLWVGDSENTALGIRVQFFPMRVS